MKVDTVDNMLYDVHIRLTSGYAAYSQTVSIDSAMYLVEIQQHPEDYRSCSDNVKYVKGNITK